MDARPASRDGDSLSEVYEIPRLAVYGSLAPGKENHHHLSSLAGRWSEGSVRGRLIESGWGASMGFPALVLDDGADTLPVSLFESEELARAWERLDEFEGSEYQRVLADVAIDGTTTNAYIYVARDPA